MGKTLKAATAEARKISLGCRYYADEAASLLADNIVQTKAQSPTANIYPSASARGDAVELPVLAGLALCRSGVNGGQYGAVKTRF